MAEAQQRLQALSEEFQAIQKDLQNLIASRQRLEAQRQENAGVEKEFSSLKNGEKIFKLVGPVLLEQEKVEAESTVKGRLEFITKEMTRVDKQIEEIQAKLEMKKTEILQIQASAQGGGSQGPLGDAPKGKAAAARGR
ncbi:hypothetical protein MKZ38_007909 [Zalerion maritima]|uniref:Prefoldin subunit 6 n=1 Tax=Zalerion maritima TaxID=339359 RepID=A0AAD5RHI9_9PEZI|nr:hypothetical protein MKZ38_007909 [Zalerion maritima]